MDQSDCSSLCKYNYNNIFIPIVTLFAFDAAPVVTTEGVAADVCVELQGLLTDNITLVVSSRPGTADGKLNN